MKTITASAVFNTHAEADRAVAELRAAGIPNSAISVVHKSSDGAVKGDDVKHADSKASGAGKGAAVGAGVGAIAGLAALAIPGVGPFIALGAMAEVLGIAGSAAVTSGLVGAAAGGLSGMMMKYGVDEEEARYYERHLNEGGYWVGVDSSESRLDRLAIERILHSAGGHSSRPLAATTTGTEMPLQSRPGTLGGTTDQPRH